MQNLIFKLPMRDASDKAVMCLSFPTGEALIAALFPYLMPCATTKAKRMVVHRAAGADRGSHYHPLRFW